jgi:hypothetical protein
LWKLLDCGLRENYQSKRNARTQHSNDFNCAFPNPLGEFHPSALACNFTDNKEALIMSIQLMKSLSIASLAISSATAISLPGSATASLRTTQSPINYQAVEQFRNTSPENFSVHHSTKFHHFCSTFEINSSKTAHPATYQSAEHICSSKALARLQQLRDFISFQKDRAQLKGQIFSGIPQSNIG